MLRDIEVGDMEGLWLAYSLGLVAPVTSWGTPKPGQLVRLHSESDSGKTTLVDDGVYESCEGLFTIPYE